VTVFVRKVVNGKEFIHASPVDLAPFRLSKGSLLSVVLGRIPCPTHSSSFGNLRNALDKLRFDPEAKELLRARPDELTTWQVKSLFAAFEVVAASWPEKTRSQRFSTIRTYFGLCDTPLKDGTRIAECAYTPQLFSGGQREIRRALPTAPEAEPSRTKVLENFSSLQERNSKSLRNALDAQQAVLEMCERTVGEHEEVKALLLDARAAGFPEIGRSSVDRFQKGEKPATATILRQTPENQLRIILKIIDREDLHRLPGRQRIPFAGLSQIKKYLAATSGQRVFELLLADRFLPRQVVVAHGITIMTVTGLNPDTLYSLKCGNIRRQGNSVLVTGLKGRIDANVVAVLVEGAEDLVKINDKRAIRALEELIENTRRVEQTFGIKDLSLFVGLDTSNSSPAFYQFDFYKEYLLFCKRFDRKSIHFRELRRLAAHVDLLSPGGNLYTVQALLNHQHTSTTVEYVNTHVVAELYEANIRRFMGKLEATALFRLGREGELAGRGLSSADIQPALFPLIENINSRARVDEWIYQNGDIELVIGIAELKHCIKQQRYYAQSYERLVSANPIRFVEVHLPRIIFCAAIREVVENSEHRGLFRKLERE
jgi:integrase